MATFVLVHGGWHGGWCWRDVKDNLRKDGHQVFTPTLTGLGERSHLASKDIDLDTHVTDVVNVFLYEDLTEVVLVGHSIGGFIITNVADRIPKQLRHLVYLDTWVPEHGKCHLDYVPELKGFASRPDGLVPVPPGCAKACGVVDPQRQQWVQSKLTPHPYKTAEGKLSFQNPTMLKLPRTYIDCTSRRAEQSTLDKSWDFISLPTGHDAMITVPNELTLVLEEIAETKTVENDRK